MSEEKIPLLERSLLLVELLPEGGAGFNEIKTMFPGVPASTVSRLLKALIAEGVIRRSESGGYEFADRIKMIARRITGIAPRHEVVRPVLHKLAKQLGESAVYFEPVAGGIVLLAKSEVPEAFHYIDEGDINTNLKQHGFNILLHGKPQREVFTNFKDDKPLLVRVAAVVEVAGDVVGAMGVSFFADGVDGERQGFMENTVLEAARAAGREISQRMINE